MTDPGRFMEAMTWPEIKQAFDKKMPILIPIGAAAKEHGPHLPMNNDYILARKLSEAVAAELPILVAPVIGFGYYPAFRAYPGSQHIGWDTFARLLTDLIENYISQGNDRIALLNTGYSTEGPISEAISDIWNRRQIKIYCADLRLLGGGAKHLWQQERGSHADEKETSLMLHLTPDKVRMSQAVRDYGTRDDSVFRTVPLLDTPSGTYGDPTLADAAKGAECFKSIVDELVNGLRSLFFAT